MSKSHFILYSKVVESIFAGLKTFDETRSLQAQPKVKIVSRQRVKSSILKGAIKTLKIPLHNEIHLKNSCTDQYIYKVVNIHPHWDRRNRLQLLHSPSLKRPYPHELR